MCSVVECYGVRGQGGKTDIIIYLSKNNMIKSCDTVQYPVNHISTSMQSTQMPLFPEEV